MPADAASAVPDAFAASVSSLIGRPLAATELFAVAVSGGPDSLALLALAATAFGDRVRALTVDHRLRADSCTDAVIAATAAAACSVPHVVLPWTGPKPVANLQAAARTARYALMRDWCVVNGVAWLATAHHRDDQAETLLLRLARGAGAGGLSSIRPRRDLGGVTLLRPLLGASKAELAAVAAAAGWRAADDPANRSDRFDRTRVRSLLAAAPWLDPVRVAASAAHLADAEAALAWTADIAWASRVEIRSDAVIVDAMGLPHEIARRLVVRAVTILAPAAIVRGDGIERLMRTLSGGKRATLAGVAARSVIHADDALWHFTLAAPRRKS